MSSRVFTSDWASAHFELWAGLLEHLRGAPGALMLEIGSHEGRSALWFLDHILTGDGARLYCVDPWFSEEYGGRFDANTAAERADGRLVKIRSRSRDLLSFDVPPLFDAIYIDGDHSAAGVLTDLAVAWPRLAVGGVLIFDDYAHPEYPDMAAAIDWWLARERGRLEPLERGWQIAVRRCAEGWTPIPICKAHRTAHANGRSCGQRSERR